MEITIRKAIKADVPEILELVKVLAAFEKAEDQVTNTIEAMEKDGFGDNPIFEAFVAHKDGQMIGIAVYYFRYSTWKGKRMYLEDIVVLEEFRGVGAGKQLFEKVIQEGKDTQCTGMMWQVLDWNKSAIDFYERYNAKFDDDWVNCKLDF